MHSGGAEEEGEEGEERDRERGDTPLTEEGWVCTNDTGTKTSAEGEERQGWWWMSYRMVCVDTFVSRENSSSSDGLHSLLSLLLESCGVSSDVTNGFVSSGVKTSNSLLSAFTFSREEAEEAEEAEDADAAEATEEEEEEGGSLSS